MTARARMLVVGVFAPLVIAAAGVIAILVVLPALPDPVAVHWGLSGAPDSFGSPVPFLLLIAGLVIAYSALCFAVARAQGPTTANQRIILAISPFLAAVITVIGAGSLVIQAGIADAREAPSVVPLVVVAWIVGVFLAVLSLLVLPRSEPVAALAEGDVPNMQLGASERAVWMQRVGPSPALVVFLVVTAAVVFLGGGAVVWLRAPLGALVFYLVILILVGLIVTATLAWKVSVDNRGLVVRSLVGVPAFRVPLPEVEAATSVVIDPISDFGGWGIRWGGHRRLGVVLRRGEAIEVRRLDGRTLVVTVAHSQRGAALLNSLARRVEWSDRQ
ncbi:hypothetical protein BH09ACT5_BH09ACT5_22390 [soil metagenome]